MRKTSQAALLVLLEQELIERYDVETKVCPVLVELTAPDSHDDVKTEAVAVSRLVLHAKKFSEVVSVLNFLIGEQNFPAFFLLLNSINRMQGSRGC